MLSALYGLEQATIASLQNKQASLQQDDFGVNIGMWVAMKGSKNVTLVALKNKDASKQRNMFGKSILDYARCNKLVQTDSTKAPKEDKTKKQKLDESNQREQELTM